MPPSRLGARARRRDYDPNALGTAVVPDDPDAINDLLAGMASDDAISKEARDNVVAAHKTVDTFAGLIGRKLWLRQSRRGEGAATDGWEIHVPFDDPDLYQIVEHEIAHNLFQSNFPAVQLFTDTYLGQVEAGLKKGGVDLANPQDLAETVRLVLNIIEDRRVNSLWAMLYPGSFQILHAREARECAQHVSREAKDNLVALMLCVSAGVDVKSKFDRFVPAIQTALKRVERRGFAATLALTKWLLTQLVTEMVRVRRQEPPPPPAPGDKGVEFSTDLGFRDPPEDSGGSDASPKPSPSAPGGPDGDAGADAGVAATQGTEPASGESPKGAAAKPAKWIPPEVKADVAARAEALRDLAGLAAKPKSLRKLTVGPGDVLKPRFENREQNQAARQAVNDALTADLGQGLDALLDRSSALMAAEIERIRQRISRPRSQDEWLSRDVRARVEFRPADALVDVEPMPPGDRAAVRRLREIFQRTQGRRRVDLSDSGTEIDVPALVDSLVGGRSQPVFRQDAAGRGFRALVLIDRSGSMHGTRTKQAERATRILNHALRGPNVSLTCWGFQSFAPSSVTLTRVPTNADIPLSGIGEVTGNTPTHLAVQMAAQWLRSSGGEKKQLIVVTDGEPCMMSSAGQFSLEQLVEHTRREIFRARKGGVNVTGVLIGTDMADATMSRMFGSRRSWDHVTEGTLERTLVRTIVRSFTDYLKHG